ncbi:MAG: carbon storage regulator [Planctomycetaceae bacterium]|nr:carbon storage regulator [Planctomycetaceae bacterium]
MLVLTRKKSQLIQIGENIVIKIIRTSIGSVKIGIDAPKDIRIMRGELDEVLSLAYDATVCSQKKSKRILDLRSTPLMMEKLATTASANVETDCSPCELVDGEEPVCLSDYQQPKTVQAS